MCVSKAKEKNTISGLAPFDAAFWPCVLQFGAHIVRHNHFQSADPSGEKTQGTTMGMTFFSFVRE
jgi:hypothetical protein